MPTGYTAAIKDGIEFKDFVLSCARAFGALILMRDEPSNAEIPEQFEPHKWNLEKLDEAKAKLIQYRNMPPADAELQAQIEYEKEVDRIEKVILEYNELREKYNTMLALVKAWRPPSHEHTGLKKFMIEQLESSIDFDCDTKYYVDNPPQKLTATEWLNKKIQGTLRDIDYHSKEWANEVERTESRNKWIEQLRESL